MNSVDSNPRAFELRARGQLFSTGIVTSYDLCQKLNIRNLYKYFENNLKFVWLFLKNKNF